MALPLAVALGGFAGAIALLLGLIVGVSRCYLGVHYPGDVLGWLPRASPTWPRRSRGRLRSAPSTPVRSASSPMRVLFTVQGQGRGHLTQAIAVAEVLSAAGHELVGVVAGNHPGRDLPSFFTDAFAAPVTMLPSPGFIFLKDRGVDLPGTLLHAARHVDVWRESLERLVSMVDETQPDVIVNFFEPLMGLLQAIRPLRVPVVAVAHQFALLGPAAGAPSGTPVAPWWLRVFVRFVGCRQWKIALSFTPADARVASPTRVIVAPPLLRRRVVSLQVQDGDYVLVYVATHGYAELIRSWHRAHPEVRLHCFYDRPGAPKVEMANPNLSFHALDAEEFIHLMAGCRAVMCTAGFESVCEAAFLGKPVLMVPLDNHHEQELNARDAERAGVAISHPTFDLDALARLPVQLDTEWFRAWCLEAEPRLVDTLERIAGRSELAHGGRPSIAA